MHQEFLMLVLCSSFRRSIQSSSPALELMMVRLPLWTGLSHVWEILKSFPRGAFQDVTVGWRHWSDASSNPFDYFRSTIWSSSIFFANIIHQAFFFWKKIYIDWRSCQIDLLMCSFLCDLIPCFSDSVDASIFKAVFIFEGVTTKRERGFLGFLKPSLAWWWPLSRKGHYQVRGGPPGSPEAIPCLVVTPFKAESLPSEIDCSCELA